MRLVLSRANDTPGAIDKLNSSRDDSSRHTSPLPSVRNPLDQTHPAFVSDEGRLGTRILPYLLNNI